MLINNKPFQTIWLSSSQDTINVIDQTVLPHKIVIREIHSSHEAALAIKNMVIRGAPLIGVMGAYGLMLGIKEDPSNKNLEETFTNLKSTRPTAVNLRWALQRVFNKVKKVNESSRFDLALREAQLIEKEDIKMCSSIGDFGLKILLDISKKKENETINILTHCNAGWLATVDWGTALAPVYKAKRLGLNLHVWVEETRPRNQGANLTAFELMNENIPHTVIVDNAGGYLMQNNLVDLVLVGSDRTTFTGDVCNKIGTYLKALAAKDNNVPFYAALPLSTIDWEISDGVKGIDIEARSEDEITHITGIDDKKIFKRLRIMHEKTRGFNPGFDVTPSNLVTGLITERGICKADEENIKKLYKDINKK